MDDGTPDAGAALLERAVGYALCALRPVTPRALGRPTPCAHWDLRALLWHATDSLAALCEGLEGGHVAPPAPVGDPLRGAAGGPTTPDRRDVPSEADDPAVAFRTRAARLMGSCAGPGGRTGRLVAVDDLPLTASALAHAGALEIAVHGWDVAQSTGLPRPVPAALATALLRTARQLVPGPDARHPLFAAPLAVPAGAEPGDRLVAFLGRDPYGGVRGGSRGGEAEPEGGGDGSGRDAGGRAGSPGPAAPA